MKSHVNFANEDITVLKGCLDLFREALEKNPKIVPVGRPWNDNERQSRIGQRRLVLVVSEVCAG